MEPPVTSGSALPVPPQFRSLKLELARRALRAPGSSLIGRSLARDRGAAGTRGSISTATPVSDATAAAFRCFSVEEPWVCLLHPFLTLRFDSVSKYVIHRW